MKKPFVTAEQLQKIVQEYPTPFHLYDEAGIRRHCRMINEAFSWNPGFREHFAVKATPNPSILKIMKEEGCGVDTASLTELMLAERCGFEKEEIFFTSIDTPAEDFQKAYDLHAIINFDDPDAMNFFEEHVGKLPKTACLRYNPGGVFTLNKSHEGFQVMGQLEENKFGMTKDQIFACFRRLKEAGCENYGLHTFLASNTLSDDYYPTLARIIFSLAVEVKETLGISVSFINLSGGIGVPYKPDERSNNVLAIGAGVKKAYEEILVPAGLGNVRLCTELGRWMTAENGCIVTKVIHLKDTYRHYAGVDANACNLMRPAMYGAYHHITVMGKEDAPCDHVYDVIGDLCENNDKLAIQRSLPELSLGDLLVIHDTGAHGFSMGYNYNGRLRSAELLLKEDGTVKMIRRPETPDDYFATLNF